MAWKLLAVLPCAALLSISPACKFLSQGPAQPPLPPIVAGTEQEIQPSPSATEDFSIATRAAEDNLRATRESLPATGQALAQSAIQAAAERATAEAKSRLAQLNWYPWWKTGLSPVNFVHRAHPEWETASKMANWFASGCGLSSGNRTKITIVTGNHRQWI